jgi:hypothetical protein
MIVGELAEEGRSVPADVAVSEGAFLGRGHGITDIPWGPLRSRTAR